LDLFFFFCFFELLILPMYFLIGVWGSRSRKIFAAYQFFIYTLLGSIFVLFSFLNIFFLSGSSSFDIFSTYNFSIRGFFLWLILFIGFCFKLPTIPFHIWLPEAHVEAPTVGSVILAAIILKIAVYSFIRFLLGVTSYVPLSLFSFALLTAFISFLYASLMAFVQIDVKKIIAYSSIAHMNFLLFGLFSQNLVGLLGAFYMVFGHALTSSALFFGVGFLYERYKTRLLFYYSSLASFMPVFSFFFFGFLLSNFAFPSTVNFVGEFLIGVGGISYNTTLYFLNFLPLILSLIYSLILYVRIFFGNSTNFIRFYGDLSRLEFFILSILSLSIFFSVFFLIFFFLTAIYFS
jgi:proton-translocating NADH-quinone oxidoreductase chain M